MEDAGIKAGFEEQAKNRFMAFKNIMNNYFQELKALEALYAASEKVTRSEFRVFSETLLSHYGRTRALEWVPRVPDSGRAVYEAEARREGPPDFQITEKNAQEVIVKADRRGEYFPIHFIEPYKGNEEVPGYDLSSEPIGLAALNLARDTGQVTATARIKLAHKKEESYGVLILRPVYRKGLPADSIESRRRNLEGFVLGAFREGDLLEEAISSFVPEGIDVYLYDNSAPPNDNFLYFHSTRTRAVKVPRVPDVNELTKGLHYSGTFDVGGRQWLVLFVPTPDYISSNKTWYAWWLLAGGVLFTGMLAGYINLITGQTARARQYSAELFRAKEELSRTYHTLSALLNNIPDLAWVKDSAGRLVIVNEAYSRACGVPIDEMPGKTDLDIWPRELAEKYIADDRHVMAVGQQQQVEEPYVDAEGRSHFIETIKTPFKNDKGTIIGTVGIARDITERKKTEEEILRAKEEWEKTFDTIPDIVLIIDNQYRIIRANTATAEKLGVPKEELVGKLCYNLLHNTDAPPEYCPHHMTLTAGKKHLEEFYSENLKAHYIISATPLYDSEGRLFGIVEVAHDISDRKRMEDRIRASLEEKEVLLREIHHRVKNNMTVIYSLLDLQSKYTKEMPDREMLNDAKARIKTMARIHEKLYRSGDMAKIDFSDYLRDILNDMFRSYVKDPGRIALKTEVYDVALSIDEAIPCGLSVNELVTNTLKHAFPEGRKGVVRVGMRSYDNDMVELIVADNGVGFPVDLDSRKKSSLGLNLIDALVKQLQGEIELRKEEGTGFRITFRKRK
jgi:PAS domain S-box-containing protein